MNCLPRWVILPIFLLSVSLEVLGVTEKQNKKESSSYSDWYKKFKYETSLEYTKFTQKESWWTKIEPYNFYLGALPLKNKGHLEAIAHLGVTHVMSIVENFELQEGWINTPVLLQDWQEKGIGVTQIAAKDFSPLTASEIKQGIETLAALLEQGDNVYLHCKAGRGRSATIAIAYLMHYQSLSFDEAFHHVEKLRPEINLNVYQRQAIFDYFELEQITTHDSEIEEVKSWTQSMTDQVDYLMQNSHLIGEDKLTNILEKMLDVVIDGTEISPDHYLHDSLTGWIPTVAVESTLSRRNRYLREYAGDQVLATEASIKRNHGMVRRLKIAASGVIPFIGIPTSCSLAMWHQLREIALIAALQGHDIHDPVVKMKMLSALAGGNLLKIPAASIDLVTKQIIKKILVKVGIKGLTSSALPAHFIFNFFTDNSAKVSAHAKLLFAGEYSLAIPVHEYVETIKE